MINTAAGELYRTALSLNYVALNRKKASEKLT